MKSIISTVTGAVLGGLLSLGIYDYLQPVDADNKNIPQVNSNEQIDAANAKLTNYMPTEAFAAPDMANAAEASVNAVVHVKSTKEGEEYYQVDPFRYFFYGDKGEAVKGRPQVGFGSGVVISDDGYIVTNNHVIENADKIEVTLNDNRSYGAELIGTDPSTDIALLKVDAQELPIIAYGNSDELRLGEWVLAVGNPFNLTSTVTAGIVSAKGRNLGLLRDANSSVAPLESFIQTDAAVNRGNSGGALVNAQGKLVGINTAIKSETGSYSGYSFAVPVNLVSKVVDDLLEFGAVQRAFIGVSIRNVDEAMAEQKDLSILSGVYVAGLMEKGAAEGAGIEEGDVIVKVANMPVNDVAELQERIGRFRPGNEVMVTVMRDGEEIEIPVTLTNRFGNTEIIEKKQVKLSADLGASFKELSKGELKKLGIDNGIQINNLKGGKLRSSGIREGFIITHIDKKPVGDFEDLIQELKNSKGGVLIEGVYPNGIKGYYGLGL